ncbi:hypothetical protein PUN28_013248 [Cardiocondyla obscurior]|uniref:Uncharacterized protein n=1 Tax=Cardiocondyla obscurior TaxID=286306 RepID=A0AAW2F8V9_9HYME
MYTYIKYNTGCEIFAPTFLISAIDTNLIFECLPIKNRRDKCNLKCIKSPVVSRIRNREICSKFFLIFKYLEIRNFTFSSPSIFMSCPRFQIMRKYIHIFQENV